jgi:hypothetical protein
LDFGEKCGITVAWRQSAAAQTPLDRVGRMPAIVEEYG